MTAHEVRCYSCDVSFPQGTKQCMHCGGRTGQRPVQGLLPPGLEPPRPLQVEAEDADESNPLRRGPARMVMGAVWVLLALVASLYRVCTG
ncbi:MAG: hypothetical protein O7A09_11195 [Proteobacteria bacterium]|nr:hypothetical protein [Pseudomonadota bacterium]